MSLYFNFPAIKWVEQYFLSPTDLPGYDLSEGGRFDNRVNVLWVTCWHPSLVQGQQALLKHKMITDNTGLWTVCQYNLWLGPANRNLLAEVTTVCGRVIWQKHAVCGLLIKVCTGS